MPCERCGTTVTKNVRLLGYRVTDLCNRCSNNWIDRTYKGDEFARFRTAEDRKKWLESQSADGSFIPAVVWMDACKESHDAMHAIFNLSGRWLKDGPLGRRARGVARDICAWQDEVERSNIPEPERFFSKDGYPINPPSKSNEEKPATKAEVIALEDWAASIHRHLRIEHCPGGPGRMWRVYFVDNNTTTLRGVGDTPDAALRDFARQLMRAETVVLRGEIVDVPKNLF